MNDKNTLPQSSLILRVLGGGYLVYLAWDMREAFSDGLFYAAAIIVFAVVGALLAGHSIWVLVNHQYFRKDTETNSEEMEESDNE